MSFRYRLLIIIPLFIIFVIAAPALILYGEGYRYDWQNKRLSQTGNLFIDSSPRQATVLLNNQPLNGPWYQKWFIHKKILGIPLVQGSTPTIINNLLPNKYDIAIEKANYRPWRKTLKILPQQTTNTGRVDLFLAELSPRLITKDQITFLSPVDNNRQTIYATYQPSTKTSTIKLLKNDPAIYTTEDLAQIPGKVSDIQKINNDLIIKTTSNFYLINISSPKDILPINTLVPGGQKVSLTNNVLYAQAGNKIYIIDQGNKKASLYFDLAQIYGKKFILNDWAIKNNYFLIVKGSYQGSWLEMINLASEVKDYNLQSVVFSLMLPADGFKINTNQINDDLVILNNSKNIIIVDVTQKTNYLIYNNNANNAIVRPGEKDILLTNDFEASLISLIKNTNDIWETNTVLLNRGSEKIKKIIWSPNYNYCLSATANNINVVELDDRNGRNIDNIFAADSIQNIWFSTSPDYLYLLGQINKQNGIWQIKIH
jgi:hypothetical protein